MTETHAENVAASIKRHNEWLAKKFEAEIEEAKKLGNEYLPDMYGRFPWDRSERRGKRTTLSKQSMGEFCYAIIKAGGDIKSMFPMSIQYHRSAIFYRVFLSLEQKKQIEEETGYRFDSPPVVKLS